MSLGFFYADSHSEMLRFRVHPFLHPLPFSFQSAGKKGRAIFIAMLQSGAIFIPLLLFLPRVFGLIGLELAHPAAYAIAGFISLPFALAFLRTLKKEEEIIAVS